jgi:uncharacterized protein with HEPN domain
MSPRNWKMRIKDILVCIEKIERHTKSLSYAGFEKDDRTIDAVLRNLEIIGEAARHVPREIKDRFPDVPWVEMQTMRNIVIHEYHGVNLRIIWQTVERDLPALKPQLQEILRAE